MENCIYCNTKIESGLEVCTSCGMSLVENHTLKPGTIIGGKYEVVKKLGEGGFGITYVVNNLILEETQAMKELFIKSTCGRASTSQTNTNHVYSSQNQDFDYYKKKFKDEMRTLLKISHDNIVRMYDVIIENNTIYGVMEYLKGTTLKKRILEKGVLNEHEALDLLNKIGGGLKTIHELGLTHRDIKPDNIMLTSTGDYKIIDFGLVKEYQEASVTLSQVVSEGYSPKEQYRKKGKVIPATDIYSLGMTIYSALSGNLNPDNPTDRSDKEVENDFQDELSSLNVSDKLKSVLKKMTEIEKSDRYQDFGEIFAELDGRKIDTTNATVLKPSPVKPEVDYEDTEEDVPENYEDTTEDKPDIKPVYRTSQVDTQKTEPPLKKPKKNLKPIYVSIAAIVLILIAIFGFDFYQKNQAESRLIAERQKIVADSLHQITREQTTRKAADEKAWEEAKSRNNIISYEKYLTNYKSGIYASEANSKLSELKKIAAATEQERQRAAEQERKAQQPETRQEVRQPVQQTTGGLIDMIFVQGGTFQMGSNSGSSDEKPVHSVTVGDFYIGKTEVTQAQYQAVMGTNPSHFKGNNLPVERVTWFNAVEFCNKLSEMEGLQKAYTISGSSVTCNWNANGYRLPTEAEWEYAARGGSQSRGFEYSGSSNISDVAWYSSNSGSKTNPVGTKQPNELGIYDMSGNVWEWCSDWYDSNYYKNSPSSNPTGPSSGSNRVIRGGSWRLIAEYCRVAGRYRNDPEYSFHGLGFRVVRLP